MKPSMPEFQPRSACFGLVCLLWGLLAVGCAPKRVINNEIYTEPVAVSPSRAPTPAPVPEPGFGRQVADLARRQLGKMYQWGGTGPDRFDCSGLVWFVYSSLGVDLPRVTSRQAGQGGAVDRNDLRPGDLLCFATEGADIDHVGIYLGDQKFVHAPRRGIPVRTDSLHNGWWRQKFRGARRIDSPSR